MNSNDLNDLTTLKKAAEEYGTPLFVYERKVMEKQFSNLRHAMPSQVEIFYAMKANPNKHVVALFHSLGAGIDIASGGELETALAAGASGRQIIFTGPGKTSQELSEAVDAGVQSIHVEAFDEAQRLDEICRNKKTRQKIGLRINLNWASKSGVIKTTGKSQKFGVDQDQALEVIERIRGLSNLEFEGIHVFSCSQVLDYRVLAESARQAIEFASKIPEISYVDIGGGLGVPYNNEEELDVISLGKEITQIAEENNFSGRILLETGRYLTAKSGWYVTQVISSKKSGGKQMLVCDGGINHLARPALLNAVHRVHCLKTGVKQNTDVGGPLCTPIDFLAKNVELPHLEHGDLLFFENCGAYGYTEGLGLFLSHNLPCEVMLKPNSTTRLVRKKITVKELLKWQDC